MTWIRLLTSLLLALLGCIVGIAGVVMSFALAMRAWDLHTVWDGIFPWPLSHLALAVMVALGTTAALRAVAIRLKQQQS